MLLNAIPMLMEVKILLTIQDERRSQRVHEPLCDQGGVARIFYLIEQDGELVSPEPRDREKLLDARHRVA